jgi:HPt (histidine-containing phosphotransfer) domain-containing protein
MEQDMTWLYGTGLDVKAGLDYTGGQEKYLSALQRFYRNYEKNRDKVSEFFEAKDNENLMITVHALKSNARMIGAMELSSGFEALETAAGEKDEEFLRQMMPVTMKAYGELIEKLSPIGEMEGLRAADELTAEEAQKTAKELLEALDEFDDELAGQLVQKLSGYPFRITWRDKLKEAAGCIDDFMYDEAAKIIREILPAIE